MTYCRHSLSGYLLIIVNSSYAHLIEANERISSNQNFHDNYKIFQNQILIVSLRSSIMNFGSQISDSSVKPHAFQCSQIHDTLIHVIIVSYVLLSKYQRPHILIDLQVCKYIIHPIKRYFRLPSFNSIQVDLLNHSIALLDHQTFNVTLIIDAKFPGDIFKEAVNFHDRIVRNVLVLVNTWTSGSDYLNERFDCRTGSELRSFDLVIFSNITQKKSIERACDTQNLLIPPIYIPFLTKLSLNETIFSPDLKYVGVILDNLHPGSIFHNFVLVHLNDMRAATSYLEKEPVDARLVDREARTIRKPLAVIVEPRSVIDLEYCVRNVLHYLGPAWTVQIQYRPGAHGNEKYVRWAFRNIPRVTYFPLESHVDSQQSYSDMLLNVSYWRQLNRVTDKVLIFQSDTVMLRSGIEDYLNYIYIGAPWSIEHHPWLSLHQRRRKLLQGVGNGGFSFRDVKTMIAVTSRKNLTFYAFEDVEITQRIDRLRGFPHRYVAYTFSVECVCPDIPLIIDFDAEIKMGSFKIDFELVYALASKRGNKKRHHPHFIPLAIHKIWDYIPYNKSINMIRHSLPI